MLEISDNLKLPLEAVTQTFAILAKRGAGKTYTASVMAEEMLAAKQQIVAIDPTGAWWGLRSSADGRSPGFPIVVLGGDHGDLPLEEHAGELIAQAITENHFSAVLDFSAFRKGQLIRFMVQFAETLYRLNREPLHLFVDEADAVAPQGRTYGGEENRMLGAMEDIVRRGRKRGIGCTLITQRPSVLNKNVLTQCESLVAMRLMHPRDIDPVTEWINVHAEPKQSRDVLDSLPTLGTGEAWFWSPSWIGTLKRIRVRERTTFDSSATPKPGQQPKKPRELASVDLASLGKQIAAAAETAKANDPRELKRKIAELERQAKSTKPDSAETAKASQAAIDDAVAKAVTKALAERDREWQKSIRERDGIIDTLKGRMSKAAGLLHVNGEAQAKVPVPAVGPRPAVNKMPRLKNGIPLVGNKTAASGDISLPKGELAILTAVAQHADFGGCSREQLTVLTGYKRSSRDAYIQRLREKGMVAESPNDFSIVATSEGLAALGSDFAPLPTGEALLQWWLPRLPEGERRVLECLVESYPNEVARTLIDDQTGYKRSSRDAYLQRLGARRLVTAQSGGMVRASEMLFD